MLEFFSNIENLTVLWYEKIITCINEKAWEKLWYDKFLYDKAIYLTRENV
jgi:hypothetical protein